MFIAQNFAPSRHTLLCIYIYINDISKWLWRPIFWHSAPKTLIIARRMWCVLCLYTLLGFMYDIANSNTWVNLFNEYNIICNLSLVKIRSLSCYVILFYGGPIRTSIYNKYIGTLYIIYYDVCMYWSVCHSIKIKCGILSLS